MAISTGLSGVKETFYDIEVGIEPSELSTTSLTLETDIFYTDEIIPVLGTLKNIQNGFLFDRTIQVSPIIEQFSYNTYTGGLSEKIFDGSAIGDFQSGSIESFQIERFSSIYRPIVNTGSYTVYNSVRRLYGDYSVTEIVSPLNTSGERNNHYLDSSFIKESIMIRKFRRVDSLLPRVAIELDEVEDLDDSSYNNKYVVIDDTIIADGDYVVEHGIDLLYPTLSSVQENMILLGVGINDSKDFYIEYFPVVPETIKAYIVYENGLVERWKFVDNFNTSISSDTHLVLNKELGVITCGGFEYDSLIGSSTILEDDTEISFFTVKDISAYPSAGIIRINDETIYYGNKTHNKFTNLIRGYLSTTVTDHSIGSEITFERKGYPITEDATLYIYYESTLRVDYEITSYKFRTGTCDVRPSKNVTAAKIVQIDNKLQDVTTLTLTADRTLIAADTYGPLYFGNDVSQLIATALDFYNDPVTELPITIEILDPVFGLIDGETTEVTKISNTDGQIFAYYNAPIDIDSTSKKFSSITYDESSTVFNMERVIDSSVETKDVWIFQIFKQDPSIGSIGVRYLVSEEVNAVTTGTTFPNATFQVTLTTKISDIFKNGVVYLVSATGTVYTRSVIGINEYIIFCTGSMPSSIIEYAYLLTSDDLTWDSNELNGVDVIIYKYSNEVLHPIKGTIGAWAPIKPSSISGGDIIYSETLPIPYPEAINSNLGGYKIILPITLSLRAKAIDPYTGTYIYSNIIKFLIKLPNYLVGVDYSGSLPIPTGSVINSIEENSVGSGLGGAVFLSVNSSGLFGLKIRFNS